MHSFSLFCILVSCVSTCLAASKDQWRGKVIYQILTDRFDQSSSHVRACGDLTNYCGGTFQGIMNRLDYIADLGVDAIWISPVIENTAGGYHGYWAKNLYAVNPMFGTESDLKNLVSAVHSRGMMVMVDVVSNHMGSGMVDVPELTPFNDTSYFHDCGCVEGDCCPSSCWVEDYHNQDQMLHCQLFGLPDLNQDLPYVGQELKAWISSMVKGYNFDGIRLDTVPYVKEDYWKEFNNAAGVFSIGEVSSGDFYEVAKYVQSGSMDATLQYPLYHYAIETFAKQSSMKLLTNALDRSRDQFGAQNLPYLGVFAENHDNPRFLAQRYDFQANRNMILFCLFTEGIPAIYYGQEQGYHGGPEFEDNREPLWTSGFKQQQSFENMYSFVQTAIKHRKSTGIANYQQTEIWADDEFYAFSRGDNVIALTNVGEGAGSISRTLSGFGVPFKKGTVVCNIFYVSDCLVVENDYELDIVLVNGECKVYSTKW